MNEQAHEWTNVRMNEWMNTHIILYYRHFWKKWDNLWYNNIAKIFDIAGIIKSLF